MTESPEGGVLPLMLDYCETGIPASPEAIRRVREHADDLNAYPRGLYRDAVRAAARAWQVDENRVVLTDGVDEATDLVLLETKSLTCVTPGFFGYTERAEALDIPITRVPLTDDWDLPRNWTDGIGGDGSLMVAQPNNPTGRSFSRPAWLAEGLRTFRIVMIDETYRLLSEHPAESLMAHEHKNLLTFVSFSKVYGIAGVRAGALVGPPDLIDKLARRKRFHSVDRISLHAVIGALEDGAAVALNAANLRRLRSAYAEMLGRFGEVIAEVRNTDCTFVLCRVHDSIGSAQLVRALAERGVVVADCETMGLPGWMRVGVADEAALARLSSGIEDCAANVHVSAPRC